MNNSKQIIIYRQMLGGYRQPTQGYCSQTTVNQYASCWRVPFYMLQRAPASPVPIPSTARPRRTLPKLSHGRHQPPR